MHPSTQNDLLKIAALIGFVIAMMMLAGCGFSRPPQRLVVVSFNRTNESVTANILNHEHRFTTNSVETIRAFTIKAYGATTNTIVILNVINLE